MIARDHLCDTLDRATAAQNLVTAAAQDLDLVTAAAAQDLVTATAARDLVAAQDLVTAAAAQDLVAAAARDLAKSRDRSPTKQQLREQIQRHEYLREQQQRQRDADFLRGSHN